MVTGGIWKATNHQVWAEQQMVKHAPRRMVMFQQMQRMEASLYHFTWTAASIEFAGALTSLNLYTISYQSFQCIIQALAPLRFK